MHTKPSPAITNIKTPRKQVPHSVKGFVIVPLNREGVLEQERVSPSPKHRFGSAHTLYATALGVLQPRGILSPLHHIYGDKEPWLASFSWLLFHKSARLMYAAI